MTSIPLDHEMVSTSFAKSMNANGSFSEADLAKSICSDELSCCSSATLVDAGSIGECGWIIVGSSGIFGGMKSVGMNS